MKVLHKIRSTFYSENILWELLCKLKEQVATEVKNNIIYETDWSNCKAINLGESRRSLKLQSSEHERCDKNCDCVKIEIAKYRCEEESC